MEALVFILLVIILVLLFNLKSQQKNSADRIYQIFLALKKELKELKEVSKSIATQDQPIKPTDENIVQWRPYIPPEIIEQEVVHAPIPPSLIKENQPVSAPAINATEEEDKTANTPHPKPAAISKTESWSQKWLRNNPDLEKFIGENLINKIGITVLLLGIAFFVKYAIGQDWIKEAGRVSIGIGCGLILIGLAHYLRNTYRSFSSVLAGGGIAVFYFTIAFAFHQYQLFSQTAAFAIMVAITVFAVLLSILYNKPELAVIAVIGGYITPFLVSNGSGNYIVLFTYLLILNAGMLALAYFKKWQVISVIALFFTLVIYGGWLVQNTILNGEFTYYKNSLAFVTSFYILFLLMALVYNIRTQQPFKTFDYSLLILITFSYYSAGMTNLHFWNAGAYKGLFTIAVALVNFCLATYFYRSNKGDKNLLYLLVGLTLTFVSLAAPVQLHGHTITLFWSAEFVLLFWLYQRSNMGMYKYSSVIIVVLTLVSLLMDWRNANNTGGDHLPVIYTGLQGLVTNIVAVVAFILYAILLRKEQRSNEYVAGFSNNTATTVMILLAGLLFYLTCIFGVNLFFYNYQQLDVPNTWHQFITYLFIVILLWIIKRCQTGIKPILQVTIIAFCVAMYLLSIPYVTNLRNGILRDQYLPLHLYVHWLAAILLLYLNYQAILLYRNNSTIFANTRNFFTWIISTVLILFFSIECMHLYTWLTSPVQKNDISIQQYSKAGLTIVWALCSFAIMWQGMKHKYKTLRIVSLCLFSVALLKLFLFDIRNISEGGKIVAFIMLGVLLLIISFMYQKLKKIIIDDAGK